MEVAAAKIRKELESAGGQLPVKSLSIKINWGQGDLQNLGKLYLFLQKLPEVVDMGQLQTGWVVLNKPPQAWVNEPAATHGANATAAPAGAAGA